MRKDIIVSHKKLSTYKRIIQFHDVPTTRDIIISVDRFFELFMKHKKNVSLPDLIVPATGKYLIDFYDINRDYLHIITLDKSLRDGLKKSQELPNAYDPTDEYDSVKRTFK